MNAQRRRTAKAALAVFVLGCVVGLIYLIGKVGGRGPGANPVSQAAHLIWS